MDYMLGSQLRIELSNQRWHLQKERPKPTLSTLICSTRQESICADFIEGVGLGFVSINEQMEEGINPIGLFYIHIRDQSPNKFNYLRTSTPIHGLAISDDFVFLSAKCTSTG